MQTDRVTTLKLKDMKKKGQPIIGLTAWDFTSGRLVEAAGAHVVLVGDSLAMTIRGEENTLAVRVEEMLYHTRLVTKACGRALVVADMPFLSYQVSVDQAMMNAGRFLQEAGAQAVKVEGGGPIIEATAKITGAGIPVVGHLGLTPQSIHQLGGYRAHGKSLALARQLASEAQLLVDAGACAIILEVVPPELAAYISKKVAIPTIGIGAGPGCDGQIQVTADLIGLTGQQIPKHAREYAQVFEAALAGLKAFVKDVNRGAFPSEANCVKAEPELKQTLLEERF